MNTSEWEQGMKRLLEDREYVPEDAAWSKMQQALHPAAGTRSLALLLPVWKIAAAAAVLLFLAGAGYLFFKDDARPQPAVAHNPATTPQTEAKTVPIQAPVAEDMMPRSTQPVAQSRAAVATTIKQTKQQPLIPKETIPAQPEIVAEHQPVATTAPQPAPAAQPNLLPKQNTAPNYHYTEPAYTAPKEKAFNLGVAANVGKPNLGNVQYNVGIVARQQLSDRFFAEANVSLASTQVRYAQPYTTSEGYTGNMGSSPNDIGNTTVVNVNYASNIIAVGVAPSIGIKATRNIAFSVGADVYKTLNRDLRIKSDLTENVKSSASIPGLIKVTDLDAGVKAQLDYRFGPRFSLSTLYRQGLTQFIIVDGKSAKNSSFNIGLKYYIGR